MLSPHPDGAEGAESVVEAAGDRVELDPETREPGRVSPIQKREKGRFRSAVTVPGRGRYVRATAYKGSRDIALDATLRAAAPFVLSRPPGPLVIPITRQDWREKVRVQKTGALFVFVVDASGSMGNELMRQTKAAILELLGKAYRDRSEAALVAFKARTAELLLPPTKSINLAERKLRDLPTGGTTPLAAGMSMGHRVVKRALGQARTPWPCMVLVTDGRANVGMDTDRLQHGLPLMPLHEEVLAIARTIRKEKRVQTVVLDTEEKHPGALDMAEQIAKSMGARYVPMGRPRPRAIVATVEVL